MNDVKIWKLNIWIFSVSVSFIAFLNIEKSVYNHATHNLAMYSYETSQDKLSEA